MRERQEPSLGELGDLSVAEDSPLREWTGHGPVSQEPFAFHREPRPEADSESRVIMWLALIIVGTTIGGLISYFAIRWYEARQVEAATQQFLQTMSSVSAQTQRELAVAQERARSQAAAERMQAEQVVAARVAAQRRAADAEVARVAAANAEAAQREAAWQKFYVPSEFCKDPDNRSSMECANAYARAQKEFEKLWAAGRLPKRL
jgi:hypothetical protein